MCDIYACTRRPCFIIQCVTVTVCVCRCGGGGGGRAPERAPVGQAREVGVGLPTKGPGGSTAGPTTVSAGTPHPWWLQRT